jgi:hypothetical protein
MDAEARQQPIADKRADDADGHVADKAKSSPAHELSGEPAGDQPNHQDDEQTFVGQIHE